MQGSENFFMDPILIQGIIISVLGNFFTFVLAGIGKWLIKKLWNKESNPIPAFVASIKEIKIPNLIELMNRAITSRNPKVVANISNPKITPGEKGKGDNDGVLLIVILVLLAASLAEFWTENKVLIFWFILLLSVIGWYVSVDYFQILSKLPGPSRLRDRILAWSSISAWIIAVAGMFLGVYRPIFPPQSFLDSGLQIIAAALISLILVGLIFSQLAIGNVYFKLMHGQLPTNIELYIWRELNRWLPFSLILLLISFVYVSGIMFGSR